MPGALEPRCATLIETVTALYSRGIGFKSLTEQSDERSHGSSAEGARVARRRLAFWRIAWVIVRAFGSVNWEPLTS